MDAALEPEITPAWETHAIRQAETQLRGLVERYERAMDKLAGGIR
jgi:hypothetical protein